jgi:hypothetical protein
LRWSNLNITGCNGMFFGVNIFTSIINGGLEFTRE